MTDEKKKHSNEDLEWIYNETFGHAIEFMKDFDVQAVAPLLSDGSLDFSSYWRHAFTHWLAYDSQFDMEHISPSEGAALAALLPEPNEVMEWLLFREPKSAKSNISSTGDPLVTDFATNEKGWNTF